MPEFPGQRPPFERGHRLTVTHGATSAVIRDPVAARIEAEVLALPGREFLSGPEWLPMVREFAKASAGAELIGEWMDGLEVGSDEWLAASNSLERCEARAGLLAGKLGLTVQGAVRLGLPVSLPDLDLALFMLPAPPGAREDAGAEAR